MRDLNQVPNMGASTADYPYGVIVDNAPGINGTAVVEALYGDIVQTFNKLAYSFGDDPSGLPDNQTNGFQILSNLFQNSIPKWSSLNTKVDYSSVKFVQYNNAIYYHKTFTNTNTAPNIDTTNWVEILRWDGSKLVFNDVRFGTLQSNIEATNNTVSGINSRLTTAEGDIDSLEAGLADTYTKTESYYRFVNADNSQMGTITLGTSPGNVASFTFYYNTPFPDTDYYFTYAIMQGNGIEIRSVQKFKDGFTILVADPLSSALLIFDYMAIKRLVNV